MTRRNLIAYSEREEFAKIKAAIAAIDDRATRLEAPQMPEESPQVAASMPLAQKQAIQHSGPCFCGANIFMSHAFDFVSGRCSQCGVVDPLL